MKHWVMSCDAIPHPDRQKRVKWRLQAAHPGGTSLAILLKTTIMKLLTTIVLGAAVAGVIYYLIDKEGAEELFSEVKDKAKDAYGKVNEEISNLKQKSTDSFA